MCTPDRGQGGFLGHLVEIHVDQTGQEENLEQERRACE